LEHAERIQQTGESQHVNVYPYDVPPIVTTTVDAIKTPLLRHMTGIARSYMGQNNWGNFLPPLMYGGPVGKASQVNVDVHSGNICTLKLTSFPSPSFSGGIPKWLSRLVCCTIN
jgi:hypothetical protein